MTIMQRLKNFIARERDPARIPKFANKLRIKYGKDPVQRNSFKQRQRFTYSIEIRLNGLRFSSNINSTQISNRVARNIVSRGQMSHVFYPFVFSKES